MYQFVETICLENGRIRNAERHNERLNRTRDAFGWEKINLSLLLSAQSFPDTGKYKIRVVYNEEIRLIEYIPYKTPCLSRIGIIERDDINYRFKSTNRDCFKTLFETYPGFDDFIIVKQGLITDSTFCNLAFLNGNQWYTPETPLLEGVQRSALLESGIIKKRNIQIADLDSYSHISFFNALNEHGSHILPVSKCIYLGKFNPVL